MYRLRKEVKGESISDIKDKTWIETELKDCNVKDKRLNKRFICL